MFFLKTVLFLYFLEVNALALSTKGAECRDVRNCPHIYELIRTKRNNYGTKTLLNLINCAKTIREFKIYCIDKEEANNFIEKADFFNGENCGIDPLVDKISGGDITAIDEFPWIALLKYTSTNQVFIYGCHANIISKRYLLTAAHCLDSNVTQQIGTLYSAILGEYDTKTETDCIGKDCNDGVKEILVESYQIHPKYNKTARTNDIGLIRLKDEIPYSDFIKPVCLPPLNFLAPYNETLYIAGWGLNEKNVMNSVKLKAKFELRNQQTCEQKYTEEQYCARSMTSAKACRGDSGGPLMVRRRDDVFRQHLIGIYSLGIRCDAFNLKLSIYTKVSSHIQWIVETIEK